MMMIFIDTGAFIARYLKEDKNHTKAIEKWDKIKKYRAKCFTSNFILDETFTLLGRWVSYSFAAEKAHIIYNSNQFEILRPTQHDELKAIEIFTKFSDHKISFTDCISVVLMRNEKLNQVFSFDKHFALMGFKPI